MSALDWLLLAAVALCAVLAWRRIRKSGGCSGCDGDCAHCRKH